MHPEADAFLDAIVDNPDDDTPRLVYADWLQEHGQENYAQFIRLQCAAAREKPWSDEANRLWEEIGRVWTKLDQEWLPATRDEALWYTNQEGLLDAVHFERGFFRRSTELPPELILRYATECPMVLHTFKVLYVRDDSEADRELIDVVRQLKPMFPRINI